MARPYHDPVMVTEVTSLLVDVPPGPIVDATHGGGGHAAALRSARPSEPIIAFDRDPDAQPKDIPAGLTFIPADFRAMTARLAEHGVDEVSGVLFDLGVSSHQLDVGERGFSYHRAGPLDMRMGPDAAHTADEIVNHWDRTRLADIIRRFGEERYADRIAAAIVAARPVGDTVQLAGVIADAVPAPARRRAHPARRTFQAIRIAANDELEALAEGLDASMRLLRSGGRIVVISYHSLEDRIVKRAFRHASTGCTCPPDMPVCGCGNTADFRLLTRSARTPAPEEVAANPRARSARLRAIERVAA